MIQTETWTKWVAQFEPELKATVSGNGIRVVLNRPDSKNSLNQILIQKVDRFFSEFNDIKQVRTHFGADEKNWPRWISLSGADGVFCSGADLGEMKASKDLSEAENLAQAKQLFAMFHSILSCPFVVIGLVEKFAMGGALGLIACCDYVWATAGTRFSFSEARLGLAPAVISPFVFARTSSAVVRQLMLSAQVFQTETAVASGLVDRVVPSAQDFQAALTSLGADLALCSPTALMKTKALVKHHALADVKAAEPRVVKVIADLRRGPSGQEGISAFFEKRAPNWIGES